MRKVCEYCGEIYRPAKNTASRQRWCSKACAHKGWSRDNPDRKKELMREHYYRKYGITKEFYEQRVAELGNRCECCGGPPNGQGAVLHIDHCHTTGVYRGLLCGKCNTALGLLDDSLERIECLRRYLSECATSSLSS